jgi:hypothetical protein
LRQQAAFGVWRSAFSEQPSALDLQQSAESQPQISCFSFLIGPRLAVGLPNDMHEMSFFFGTLISTQHIIHQTTFHGIAIFI